MSVSVAVMLLVSPLTENSASLENENVTNITVMNRLGHAPSGNWEVYWGGAHIQFKRVTSYVIKNKTKKNNDPT